jgi:hypothetical protein
MTQEEQVILLFPRQMKIDCLKAALKEDKFGVFMGLSKILLEASISDGGLETEVIEAIHNEHLRSNGVTPI